MKNTLILTAALLVSTLACKADVIVQTVNFGTITGEKQLYFSQFDTSLGTLTDVALSWTINSSISTASITNQNTGTVTVSRITFSNTVEGYIPSIGTSGDLVAEVSKSKSVTPSGGVVLTSGQSYTVNNVNFSGFTQDDNYTSADANFNSFKGTGDVPLYLTNTFGATPTASGSGSTTSWLTSITGSSTGSLQVTYTYNAAPPIAPVPEPPSIILGCGGILFMSAFAFNRRRKCSAEAVFA